MLPAFGEADSGLTYFIKVAAPLCIVGVPALANLPTNSYLLWRQDCPLHEYYGHPVPPPPPLLVKIYAPPPTPVCPYPPLIYIPVAERLPRQV